MISTVHVFLALEHHSQRLRRLLRYLLPAGKLPTAERGLGRKGEGGSRSCNLYGVQSSNPGHERSMEPLSPDRSSQISSLCRFGGLVLFFSLLLIFLHFWKRIVKMPILDVTKDSGTMHKSLLPSPLKGC